MKKEILSEFIKKYSLNGAIQKCRWLSNAKDKTLTVSVAAETRNLLAFVKLANWDGFGDAEVGVGDTNTFTKMLSGITTDDIALTLNYNTDNTRIINVGVEYDGSSATITTSDLDTIPPSSSLKTLPVFNVEIVVNDDFKQKFLKAKASLPDVNSFTVLMNKKSMLEMIIGYSNINSNRFTLKVDTQNGNNTIDKPMHFDANYLKSILSANSEAGDTTLFISDDGLASISFTSGDFTSTYYLVPLDQD